MRKWICGSVISAVAMAMIPAAGMAAVSVAEQHYVFRMDVTRDVPVRTFVIGAFVNAKELRAPADVSVAEKNKMFLYLRTRETAEHSKKHTKGESQK